MSDLNRWKLVGKFILFALLMSFLYQNCSQYGGQSPFDTGTTTNSSTTPPLPSVSPRLDSPVGVLDLSEYELNLSVGGECNLGNSAKHYIEVTLQNTNNLNLPVREDTLCPKEGTNLPPECFRARQFQCEHGRYNILLPINCSAYSGQAQSVYRLKGQLVLIDSQGRELRDTKTAFDRFFTVNWAANSCL
jgi:hypothetical protein